MWWSGSGDDLSNTMSHDVDLTGSTTAALDLQARFDIEAEFDYLYVQASTLVVRSARAPARALSRPGG